MRTYSNLRNEQGFSVAELLLVIAVIAILAGFTVFAMGNTEAYKADDQALQVLDFLKEARQRAVTQREVMRVEINRDRRIIRLINENSSGTENDDVELRRASIPANDGIIFDRAPDNIDNVPTEVTPVPAATFKQSVHPTSSPDFVATLRFQPNGQVHDAGTTARGDNSVMSGTTLYFWSRLNGSNDDDDDDDDDDNETVTSGDIIRAITILGSSGNMNYRRCPRYGSTCSAWK